MQITKKRIQYILNRKNSNETRKNKKDGKKKHNRKRRRSSRTSKARNKKPNLRYSSLKNRRHKGGAKINPNKIGSDATSKQLMERYEQTALKSYVTGITDEMKNNPASKVTINYIKSSLSMSLQDEINRLEQQKAGENIIVSLISRVRGAYKDLDIKKTFIESLKGIVEREIEVANEGSSFSGAFGSQSETPAMKELKKIASDSRNNISAISTEVFDKFNFGIGSDAKLTLIIINLELEIDELLKTLEENARIASARDAPVRDFIQDPANKINEICEKVTLLFNYIDFYISQGGGFLKAQGDMVVLGKQSGVSIEDDPTNYSYISEQTQIFNMVKQSLIDRLDAIKVDDIDLINKQNKTLGGSGRLTIASNEFVPNNTGLGRTRRSPPSSPPIVQPTSVSSEDDEGLPTTEPVETERIPQPEAPGASSSSSELQSSTSLPDGIEMKDLPPVKSGTSQGAVPPPPPPSGMNPMEKPSDLYSLDIDSKQSRAFKAMPPEVQNRIRQQDTAENTLQRLEKNPPSRVDTEIEMADLSPKQTKGKEVTGPPQPTVPPPAPATSQQQDIANKRAVELNKLLQEGNEEKIAAFLAKNDSDMDAANFQYVQTAEMSEAQQRALYNGRISILNSCLSSELGGKAWNGLESFFKLERDRERNASLNDKTAVYLCPLVKQQDEVFGQEVSAPQIQEGFGLQKISGNVAYCGFIGMLYYAVQVKAKYPQYWQSLGIPDDSELGQVIAWAERVPAGSNNVIDYADQPGGLDILKRFLVFIRSNQEGDVAPESDTYANDKDLLAFSRFMKSTICVWESQQPLPHWQYYEADAGGPPGLNTTSLLTAPPDIGIPPPCLLIHQDRPVNHFDYVNLAENAVVFQMMQSEYLSQLLSALQGFNAEATANAPQRRPRSSSPPPVPPSVDPDVSARADLPPETISSSPNKSTSATTSKESLQLPFGPESAFMCPSKFPFSGPETEESLWVTKNMKNCSPPDVLPNYFAVFDIKPDIWAGKQISEKWSDNKAFNEYEDLIDEWTSSQSGATPQDKELMKERMIRCSVPIQTKYGQSLGYLGVWTPAFKKLVEARYKKLALKFHPDRSSRKPNAELSAAKFNCISAAKEILIDENKFYRYIQLWKTCAESQFEKAHQEAKQTLPDEINIWPPSWLSPDKYKDFYKPNFVGLPGDPQFRKQGDPPPTTAELQGFSWSYRIGTNPGFGEYSNLWPQPPPAKPEDIAPSGGAGGADSYNTDGIKDPVTQRTYYSNGEKTTWSYPFDAGQAYMNERSGPRNTPPGVPLPPSKISQSNVDSDSKISTPSEPSATPSQPSSTPSQPSSTPSEPSATPNQPSATPSQPSASSSGPLEPMRGSMTQEMQPDGNIKVNISLVVPPECAKRTTIATTGNSGGQTQGVLGNMISRINGVNTNPSAPPSAPPAIEGPALPQLPPSQSDDALPQPPALPPPAVPQAEAPEDDPLLQPDGSIIVGNRLLAPDPIPPQIMSSLDISRPVELNLDLINRLLSQSELPEEIRERLIAQQNEEMRNQGRPLALPPAVPSSGGKRKNKKKKQTRKKRQKKKRTNNTRRSKGGHHPGLL